MFAFTDRPHEARLWPFDFLHLSNQHAVYRPLKIISGYYRKDLQCNELDWSSCCILSHCRWSYVVLQLILTGYDVFSVFSTVWRFLSNCHIYLVGRQFSFVAVARSYWLKTNINKLNCPLCFMGSLEHPVWLISLIPPLLSIQSTQWL